MRKLPLAFLALLVLVLVGCHPKGFSWPSLFPSTPDDEDWVMYGVCDHAAWGGYPMPAEAQGFLDAAFIWNDHVLKPFFEDAYFKYEGFNCFGWPYSGFDGPGLLLEYDKDLDHCLGDLTCVDQKTGWHPTDAPEMEIVYMYFSKYWVNEFNFNYERGMSWALRQFGEALGLARHTHTSCLPDPISGQFTIMAHPVMSCPAPQHPYAADIIGLACHIYGYDCPMGFEGCVGCLGDIGPDYDGDGIGDSADNCDYDPNPMQEDRDIDGWGDVCDPDEDDDSWTHAAFPGPMTGCSGAQPLWSECVESYLGTDPLDNCPDNGEHDAWPPDMNMDTEVNALDVFKMFPYWLQTCTSTKSQLVDVIKATEVYKDRDLAADEGLRGPVTQELVGRGAYYVFPSRWDDTLDLLEPEGLIYHWVTDFDIRLWGVLYVLPSWIADVPEGFIGDDDVWATHPGFCIDDELWPSEGTTEEDCGAAGGIWWEEMGHVLIAWTFRHNSDGVFEEVNPDTY